ncbi:hypothetical protein DENSPDRAFT_161945 [Dentipellis sp. KUC8613]|nr:hypothetical protein DENSPDRAFT_161945 [Dentipellis sp. KUC8613]
MEARERCKKLWHQLSEALNFYRIHWLFFIIAPLILSAIFFASNGRFSTTYTDALFACVSAITGTGLLTFDLSGLTAWQQAIIFILSFVGNPGVVAWFAVYIRRRYFKKHLYFIVKTEFERTKTREVFPSPSMFVPRGRTRTHTRAGTALNESNTATLVGSQHFQPGMVRRVDTRPKLVNTEGFVEPVPGSPTQRFVDSSPERMQSHEFSSGPDGEARKQEGAGEPGIVNIDGVIERDYGAEGLAGRRPQVDFDLRRRMTRRATVTGQPVILQTASSKHQDDDFGGFGNPLQIAHAAFKRFMPATHERLKRKMTMPAVATLVSTHSLASGMVPEGARQVPYLSFEARVGRNSRFHGLTDDDCEELGGIEYRALTALLWIVPLFVFGSMLIPFAVIAPYMSISRWKSNFLPPQQHRVIDPVWYSAFEVMGAWANTGMSLVDQNLVPFQRAYPLLLMVMYVGLAGNTAFPILLRLLIWVIYKCCPKTSQLRETLHFLLDHPRRCFILLFPARQTWLLFISLIFLNITDWFFFLILDLGNPTVDAIPVGIRVLLAAVQAVAVRLAGFQTLSIAALAPSVKVLYLIMMYVSAYPIAMSIRATNVYEEKSLGVFDEESDVEEEEDQDDAQYSENDTRVSILGRYLGRHIRRQLAFDLWWLAGILFLICIIERDGLNNPDNATWFNIFTVMFELVSAYSTVGLSLGIPTANFALSGAFHTLSKLLLMLVMLRGRHRGLPVALDRAVLLPKEFLQRATEKARQMKREEAKEKYLALKRQHESEKAGLKRGHH